MKLFVFFVLFFCLVAPVYADMTGAGDSMINLQLTKIYAVLQSKYAALIKELNEARTQTKYLQEVVDKARMARREYEFVKNFSVQNVINRAKNDYEGLTLLDNLDGRSTEDQLDMVLIDIDRRFDRPDPKQLKIKKKLTNRVKELQRLQTLLKAKLDEAEKFTRDDSNIKTIQSSIATTNCLLLGLEVQRQQRKILEETQDVSTDLEMGNKVDEFQHALRKMSKGSASME